MTMKKISSKAAFTMIEILLALGIFVIGIFSIISVFPEAKHGVISSEDKTITARFADSLIHAIIQGGREFSGTKATGTIYRDQVVNFSFELNDANHQDYFVLPVDPPGATDASDVVWYPLDVEWTPGGSISYPSPNGTIANPNLGFSGKVRRLGRAALGSSGLDKSITFTEENYPERLEDFYFCFSVTRAKDKKASAGPPAAEIYFANLFKVSLFIYHGGVSTTAIGANEVYTLLNTTEPTAKENNYIDRFDFLVNINKG